MAQRDRTGGTCLRRKSRSSNSLPPPAIRLFLVFRTGADGAPTEQLRLPRAGGGCEVPGVLCAAVVLAAAPCGRRTEKTCRPRRREAPPLGALDCVLAWSTVDRSARWYSSSWSAGAGWRKALIQNRRARPPCHERAPTPVKAGLRQAHQVCSLAGNAAGNPWTRKVGPATGFEMVFRHLVRAVPTGRAPVTGGGQGGLDRHRGSSVTGTAARRNQSVVNGRSVRPIGKLFSSLFRQLAGGSGLPPAR